MANENGHGGYRKPAKPAPVSGPGKMSRRTDGQPMQTLPDAAYGEQQTFRAIQSGAPMGQAPLSSTEGGLPVSPLNMTGVVPIGSPTQFPGEPVTSGAATGPGPGGEVIQTAPADPALVHMKTLLPSMEIAASQPWANSALRQLVRRIRASS